MCREAFRPDAVIHAVALRTPTCVSVTPMRRRRTTAGIALLAELCAAFGAHLIHYPTDTVFDGKQSQLLPPL